MTGITTANHTYTGKTAVITGAARGFGKAFSEALARKAERKRYISRLPRYLSGKKD